MQKPADESGVRKPPPHNAEREARLAAALRENLKRRKAQARARRAATTGESGVETSGNEPQTPSS